MRARRLLVLAGGWAAVVCWAGGCGKSESGGTSADSPAASAAFEPLGSSPAHKEDLYPIVVLRTTLGEIPIRLNAEKSPRTVYNFIGYASSGQYDQTVFHHVEEGYAVLGGGYSLDLAEKPGRYPIPNEAANGLKNVRGTIAMARSPGVIDSATCQFFINLVDNPQLDHQGDTPETYGYCVFGEVLDEGMRVLDAMARLDVHQQGPFAKLPVKTVMIQSVYERR